MASARMNLPSQVEERNLELIAQIMRFLMEQPSVFDPLPDSFELVILPEDDPEIRQHNLELLDRFGSEGKPIVFARIKAHPGNGAARVVPSIFVPLPLAV